MTIEKVVCDECGRVKAEANHWHQLMVWIGSSGALALAAGMPSDQLSLERVTPPVEPEVHDLCGEQCLHKHLAKLLGFNPETGAVTADKTPAEAKTNA